MAPDGGMSAQSIFCCEVMVLLKPQWPVALAPDPLACEPLVLTSGFLCLE